jgi:DNA-binding HxlR family transcriptional regulator
VKSYKQYCAVAHALDLVGERWSLLIVRELIEHGPLRYSDLHASLPHCGTNILATRLKELERNGIVRRRKLPPPAASTVYELTEYGEELRPVLHVLGHWGARSLRPPTGNENQEPGWLAAALQVALPPCPTGSRIEFHVGDQIASYADGEAHAGPLENPDAVVECDQLGFYRLLVDRDLDAVEVRGDAEAVSNLLARLPYADSPLRAEAAPA